MKGNVARIGSKVMDFSLTLRRDIEAAPPPSKEKKTEKPLPSAVMLSGSDFLSTRVPSRKPRDFVSKNSPPRVPVAAGLPPVESYKSRKLRQWEKEQAEAQAQAAAADAARGDDDDITIDPQGEEAVLSKIPPKLLMNLLSKEHQRQVFFAGVNALTNASEASLHSLEEPISTQHDHRSLSSWMDMVSSPPVPESMFAYAKAINGSCASAAQQSTEWFTQNETENQPQLSRPSNTVTPLMLALRRRKASSSSASPSAAAPSDTPPSSSPKSPQRSRRDSVIPPTIHLRSGSSQQLPLLDEQQRVLSPPTPVIQETPTQLSATHSQATSLRVPVVSFGGLAADLLSLNCGETLTYALSKLTNKSVWV
jgi:hypothetical protein